MPFFTWKKSQHVTKTCELSKKTQTVTFFMFMCIFSSKYITQEILKSYPAPVQ